MARVRHRLRTGAPMTLRFDDLSTGLGQALPSPVLRTLLAQVLGEQSVSLCLHRVSSRRRPTDTQPALTIDPDELDALIDLLLSSRPKSRARWLAVTFDDGYEDAALYVASRAERFPAVEFLLFVCPEKIDTGIGFRWDLGEERQRSGRTREAEVALDVASENLRPELKALSASPDFRLASLELLQAVQRLDNVKIGNHTNCHFKQTALTPEQADLEYQRSGQTFARLFGPQQHFAFPFGTPQWEFDERHVALLRARGDFLIWTTEARPYRTEERKPGAVLPRFPVNGALGHRQLAGWIAARSALARVRGPRHEYPLP